MEETRQEIRQMWFKNQNKVHTCVESLIRLHTGMEATLD